MRLTRNGKVAKYRCDYPKHTTTDCIRKLGQLEDIEEEIGIDLINFYKNYRELLSLKGRNLRISIEELQKELEK